MRVEVAVDDEVNVLGREIKFLTVEVLLLEEIIIVAGNCRRIEKSNLKLLVDQ